MNQSSHVLSRPGRASIVGIALLLVGITFLFVTPAAAQQPAGELNVSSKTIEASPGENVTINATVRNSGHRQIAQIDVWITDAPANWTASSVTIQRIPANESETVGINVTIPRNASAGGHSMTVRAESNENISAEGIGTIEILGEESTPPETEESGGGGAPPMGPVGGGGSSCDTILFTDFCWPDISGYIDGLLDSITGLFSHI